jgi:hypothetical protein
MTNEPVDCRGERTVCEVHGVDLEEDTVRIGYGLPAFDLEEREAEERLFPNAALRAMGGCMVTPDSPKWGRVRYCEECRRQRRIWEEAHPRKEPKWRTMKDFLKRQE